MRLIHLDEVRRRRARRERLSPAVQGLAWAALGLAWFGVASVLLGWILTPDERARIVAASPLAMGAACLLASISLHVWIESPRRSATPRGARGVARDAGRPRGGAVARTSGSDEVRSA